MITPTPGPHVKEMKDAAMFYTNRVLKDYKGKYIYVESRPDDVFQIQVNTIIFLKFNPYPRFLGPSPSVFSGKNSIIIAGGLGLRK